MQSGIAANPPPTIAQRPAPDGSLVFHSIVSSPKIRAILLQTARNDVPSFYAAASARESQAMDMLVLLTALFVRLNEPATRQKDSIRGHDEERAATRQMFDEIREFLQKGRTFGLLPQLEREKIQRVLFQRVE